jgi:hypothetical protein
VFIDFALIAQNAQVRADGPVEQLHIEGPANDVVFVPHAGFDARLALVAGVRYADAEAEKDVALEWHVYDRERQHLSSGVDAWDPPGFNPYAPEGWHALTVQFAAVQFTVSGTGGHSIGVRLRGDPDEAVRWIPLMVVVDDTAAAGPPAE